MENWHVVRVGLPAVDGKMERAPLWRSPPLRLNILLLRKAPPTHLPWSPGAAVLSPAVGGPCFLPTSSFSWQDALCTCVLHTHTYRYTHNTRSKHTSSMYTQLLQAEWTALIYLHSLWSLLLEESLALLGWAKASTKAAYSGRGGYSDANILYLQVTSAGPGLSSIVLSVKTRQWVLE